MWRDTFQTERSQEQIVGIAPESLTELGIVLSVMSKKMAPLGCLSVQFVAKFRASKKDAPIRMKRYWWKKMGRTPYSKAHQTTTMDNTTKVKKHQHHDPPRPPASSGFNFGGDELNCLTFHDLA